MKLICKYEKAVYLYNIINTKTETMKTSIIDFVSFQSQGRGHYLMTVQNLMTGELLTDITTDATWYDDFTDEDTRSEAIERIIAHFS